MNKEAGIFRRFGRLCVLVLLTHLTAMVVLSPMLLIAGAAYLGGRYFDRKDSKLSADGITATATVFDATYDQLGSLLQGTADDKMDRESYQRNDSAKCTIYYRFVTRDGQEIEGSVNREYASLEAARSEIGSEFEVVYSVADPSVYETAVGHTSSQSDAMYWIAIAFVVIWILSSFGCTGVFVFNTLKPKSRKQRIEELKQNQRKST